MAGAGGALALPRMAPAFAMAQGATPPTARVSDGAVLLSLDELPVRFDGRGGRAVAINGSVPGPLIRLREGQDAVIQVTNKLKEVSSLHWHGVILPAAMDGVPGVSFAGIQPGETFVYRFAVRQSGTYWYHSHSGGQELLGMYGPLVIDPAGPEPFAYDREHVIVLSDWSFEDPMTIIAKLKKQAGYYNYQKRTAAEFVADVSRGGLLATLKDRLAWARMRMDPTDFADVTGATYTYLINGQPPSANWTGLFTPGERVRLRIIAAGAMTLFDVRIPGLALSVVQADGQNVRPVQVDELRIGPGETYDVIVEPKDQAYTLFAETSDRSGFAAGTLAPRSAMRAELPMRRPRPTRTMADMGMAGHGQMDGMVMDGSAAAVKPQGLDAGSGEMPPTGDTTAPMIGMEGMGEMDTMDMSAAPPAAPPDVHAGMEMADGGLKGTLAAAALGGPGLPGSAPFTHGPEDHGSGNSVVSMSARSRLDEPGGGLEGSGRRVLVYADLRSVTPQADLRPPAREVELHITGNMDRYMWSFDGLKYSEASAPIAFTYGERLRLVLWNDTMMDHPIHLHGMWMELENGGAEHQPRKHTINVKPAERLTVAITADAEGRWAMHCHLLLHMEMGMFRVVEVSAPEAGR